MGPELPRTGLDHLRPALAQGLGAAPRGRGPLISWRCCLGANLKDYSAVRVPGKVYSGITLVVMVSRQVNFSWACLRSVSDKRTSKARLCRRLGTRPPRTSAAPGSPSSAWLPSSHLHFWGPGEARCAVSCPRSVPERHEHPVCCPVVTDVPSVS